MCGVTVGGLVLIALFICIFVGLIVGVIVAGVVLIAVIFIITCKIRLEYLKKNQSIYETKILNYLYALLRREVWAYATSLTLWYVQTLLGPATVY
jgi:hypothetical protein